MQDIKKQVELETRKSEKVVNSLASLNLKLIIIVIENAQGIWCQEEGKFSVRTGCFCKATKVNAIKNKAGELLERHETGISETEISVIAS